MKLSVTLAMAGRKLAQHVNIYNSVKHWCSVGGRPKRKLMLTWIKLCRMKIVDDDIDWRELTVNREGKENKDEDDEEEEAPVVTMIQI